MKLKMISIEWPKFGFLYKNLFKITSEEELYEYWRDYRQKNIREGFSDYLTSREGYEAVGSSKYGNHVSTTESQLLAAVVNAERCKDHPRTILEVFIELQDSVYSGMKRSLIETGLIFINPSGGYFTFQEGMIEKESVEPIVSVKQWPNGKHFYGYVNGKSISLFGANKWGNLKDAESACKEWIKRNLP